MLELFILFIIVVVAGIAVWWITTSNDFKRKKIKIDEGLSGIEVALEKRYDMLTKLRDVAKSYMQHEKEVFTKVIELRKGMSLDEMNRAEAEMDELRDRLFAVAENYPQLRSSDVVIELERGIRDAEDHLQAARRLFNANVAAYNQAIVVFPSSLVADSQHRTKVGFHAADEKKHQDIDMNF
jgi:LemA protein